VQALPTERRDELAIAIHREGICPLRFAVIETWDLPSEAGDGAGEVTQQSQDLHIGRVLSPAEPQFLLPRARL
jgi:hypothetical protein